MAVLALDEASWLEEDNPADIVFLAASEALSRRLGRRLAARGQIVIDNSSVFRMEDDVPLVVPEINAALIKSGEARLIANPNCSTIVALMALAPLHEAFGLRSFVASTYQAVSGVGQSGIAELKAQSQAALAATSSEAAEVVAEDSAAQVFARPMAFNLIPWIGEGMAGKDTSEELKMQREARKILALPDLEVFCTAVRVPVFRAHAVSIVAVFQNQAKVAAAAQVLEGTSGVRFQCPGTAAEVWTPRDAAAKDEVLVTRLREVAGAEPRLGLFAIGDQLRKGAALNAVQIAETFQGI